MNQPETIRVTVDGKEYGDVLHASVPQGFIKYVARDPDRPWRYLLDKGRPVIKIARGRVTVRRV